MGKASMEEVCVLPRSEALRLAEWLGPEVQTVVFTGAGISTESGIPDFRSPGGIWARFDPNDMTYQKFLSGPEGRRRYWRFHRETYQTIARAEPNLGHRAVAELEKYTDLMAVITQNIDGLHQKAGTDPERVLELHGTLWEARCLECGRVHSAEDAFGQMEAGVDIPGCESCVGHLKPGTISFGEPLPETVLTRAQEVSLSCEVFIAIGSSLGVYPAAYLPQMAAEAGAWLAIINRDPTPMDDLAALVVHTSAGSFLSDVICELQGLGNS